MLSETPALSISVYIGRIDGIDINEIYTVGKISFNRNYWHGKEVKEILVTQLSYTKAAQILYTDGSYQVAENVKQSFYAAQSAQGDTREDS